MDLQCCVYCELIQKTKDRVQWRITWSGEEVSVSTQFVVNCYMIFTTVISIQRRVDVACETLAMFHVRVWVHCPCWRQITNHKQATYEIPTQLSSDIRQTSVTRLKRTSEMLQCHLRVWYRNGVKTRRCSVPAEQHRNSHCRENHKSQISQQISAFSADVSSRTHMRPPC